MMLPVLSPSVQRAREAQHVAIVGTIHSRRDRWNPFSALNHMQRDADGYHFRCLLRPSGGRHGDGVYSLRFVVNGNLRRTIKALRVDGDGSWATEICADGVSGRNISFRVPELDEYSIHLAADGSRSTIGPRVEPIRAIESLELNGFVWDGEDMFLKFAERRPGHRMQPQPGGAFVLDVWLKHDGGIDFRHDGVYQFLVSAKMLQTLWWRGPNIGLQIASGTAFARCRAGLRGRGRTAPPRPHRASSGCSVVVKRGVRCLPISGRA